MKKLLLSLTAVLLSLTASAQLPDFKHIDMPRNLLKPSRTVPQQQAAKQKSPAQTGPQRVLASNQIYVSNDIGSIPLVGIGIGNAVTGEVKAGALLRSSLFANYAGSRVVGMRFALTAAVGASTVEILPLTTKGYGAAIATKTIETTQAGWNEVMFDEPYTLTGNENLVASYSYDQIDDINNPLAYPVASSGTYVNAGLLFYADLGSGLGWNFVGSSYGNLMVQLIVECDKEFAKYDLSLDALSLKKYIKNDGKTESAISLTMHNDGNNTINAADIDISIDGAKLGTLSITESDQWYIDNPQKQLTASLVIPSSIASGKHTLGAKVVKVMGETPAGDTSNDELSAEFNAYKQSKKRQKQLVEHFTSQYCTYCPEGYDMLNALNEMRSDLAWVSIHDGYENDGYTLLEADSVTTKTQPLLTLLDVRENPDAAFNRYYFEDELLNTYNAIVLGISWPDGYAQEAAEWVNEELDKSLDELPSFADMNIATSYDKATRQLTVTVSGTGVEDAKTFMDDCNLTIYVTEDDLHGLQVGYGTQYEDYTHNGVLRKILTAVLGDPITWDGQTYSATYTTTLDEAWNSDKMNVVAFLAPGKPADKRSAAVYQTEKVKVGKSSDGIAGVASDATNATVVARYNAAGQQVGTMQRGLNLVRMSDGTVRKTIVK